MSLPSPVSEPLQARCARHVAEAAVATCARCGSYACTTCLRYGADGRQYCLACAAPQLEMAGRGERFLAKLADAGLVMAFVLVGVIIAVIIGAAGEDGAGSDEAGALFALVAYGLGLLVGLGNALLEAFTGQSLGKRMVRIKVVRTDGTAVHPARLLFLRSLLPVVLSQASCGIFGLVDPLFVFADNQRCLHDLIADTQVVPAR